MHWKTRMQSPFFLVFEITKACNNNCLYCYNVWKENRDYPKEELDIDQIKRLFEKIFADEKPVGVALTGGEPMLRPDVFDIVKIIKSFGVIVGLATNGTLLNAEKVKRLVDNGVSYFEISLVSLNEERYATLSQNNKLEWLKRSILAVSGQRVPFTVSFTATKINYTDIGSIIDLCFAFSVKNIAINRFVPGGQGLKNISQLLLSNTELRSVLKIANEKAGKYHLSIAITIPVESCLIDHKDYPHLKFGACVCGKNKWAIDPAGNLRTCEQNLEILGNLLEKNFSELSKTAAAEKFKKNDFKSSCAMCAEFKNCGGGCRFLRKYI